MADFGLARFGADAGLTMTGDLLGTLRYMAPEQALAKHGLADHRCDVYGLGATLYELLTGHPAVDSDEDKKSLRRIAFEEPIAPRKLDKAIPAELETITQKCLAKEPKERYATAGELAEDLRRWLADLPIRARRPTIRQRFARWGRRHPGLTAALGLVIGLLLAGGLAWERQVGLADSAAREVASQAAALQTVGRYSEALAVAQRAADLLPSFGGDASMRRQMKQQVADLNLLTSLQAARYEPTVTYGGKGYDLTNGALTSPGLWLNFNGSAPLYEQAFHDYGVDIFVGDEGAVAEMLKNDLIRVDAIALDDWSYLSQPEERGQRLRRLVAAIDPNGMLARARLLSGGERPADPSTAGCRGNVRSATALDLVPAHRRRPIGARRRQRRTAPARRLKRLSGRFSAQCFARTIPGISRSAPFRRRPTLHVRGPRPSATVSSDPFECRIRVR